MLDRVLFALCVIVFTIAAYTVSPALRIEFGRLWVVLGELAAEWRTLLVILVVLVGLTWGLVKVLDRKYDKHN